MRIERDFRPVKAALFYESVVAIAGENADDVIRVFNSSVRDFFCLSKVARGALGLSLASGIIIDVNDFRFKKDKEILKQVLKQDWIGSAKILQKLPAIMLSPVQYKKLWTLLGCDKAKKYLQHASIIDGDTIDVLHALSVELRSYAVMKHLRHPLEARLLSRLCTSVETTTAVVQKARDAGTSQSFWQECSSTLVARAFKLQVGPYIDHPDIEQVSDPLELIRLGRSFRNCLGPDYLSEYVSGHHALYRYTGSEPVLISVASRFGNNHSIRELKGVGNAEPSDQTRQAIVQAFALAGIQDSSGEMFDGKCANLLNNFFRLSRHNLSTESIIEECTEALSTIDQIEVT